ncbi:histidine phosphatase family protein [Allopusillimonas soli]|nr:histidine phosphatase family protein [Allopusillimonas soli]
MFIPGAGCFSQQAAQTPTRTPRSMTTQFWLIRHGETQWNAERRLQGWKDVPLNDTGIRQAERLALGLRPPHFDTDVDVIVSSDLGRAHETARIAASHLGRPIETAAGLRERNYGIYEGRDWAWLKGAHGPGINFLDPGQLLEQGESLAQFHDRIGQAFAELARRHAGKNVLVFSHGGVIDICWRLASGLGLDAPRRDPVLNTSINYFCIHDDGRWQLLDWGCVSHLEDAALDDVL